MLDTSSRTVRRAKIQRLGQGSAPRVLDLFAGCGGFSLGFQAAGFEIAGGVEFDPHAARTHAQNFHGHLPEYLLEKHAQARDILETSPSDLACEFDWSETASSIDVLIGGPPCQAYARVGRAKLREVAEHPDAFLHDSRGNLYLRYIDFVRDLQPLVVVVENVPDALNVGGHNVAEEMCEVLTDLGYVARYTLLNAAFYGVPQMRERMFIVAYAEELNADISFPEPETWIKLPMGYEGSRNVALKAIRSNPLFGNNDPFFTPWPEASPDLPPAVTAEQATGDLPAITLHLEGKLKRGARRFTELFPYPENDSLHPYADMMRTWPSFEGREGVYDHVIRYLPRDYAIFARMEAGDQYPEAHRLAQLMFEEKLEALQLEGGRIKPDTQRYKELEKATVPGYDPTKFPNKWRKMEADAPARTLMAHLGKDGYSHIHYDSEQARTISVREAARLQSFPDGFVFSGTMNPAFRQIGNAVPPLLAKAIGSTVMSALSSSTLTPQHETACYQTADSF